MTGGGKTNILDVIREAVTAMDDAVLVNLNGAGQRRRAGLGAAVAADRRGTAGGRPRGCGRRSWARCAGCGT